MGSSSLPEIAICVLHSFACFANEWAEGQPHFFTFSSWAVGTLHVSTLCRVPDHADTNAPALHLIQEVYGVLPMTHRGAEARLFPACRKESRFVLSIKPEPVSTKLGTGA